LAGLKFNDGIWFETWIIAARVTQLIAENASFCCGSVTQQEIVRRVADLFALAGQFVLF
jgi:hypothetical protein